MMILMTHLSRAASYIMLEEVSSKISARTTIQQTQELAERLDSRYPQLRDALFMLGFRDSDPVKQFIRQDLNYQREELVAEGPYEVFRSALSTG